MVKQGKGENGKRCENYRLCNMLNNFGELTSARVGRRSCKWVALKPLVILPKNSNNV